MSDIAEAVAASRSAMPSLWAEMELRTRTGSTSRHVLAAHGALRFAEITHYDQVFSAEADLDHHFVFFNGRSLDVYYPALGWLQTSRHDVDGVHAWKVRSPFLMECLGWWPPHDGTELPLAGVPFFLHDALAQPDCVVAPWQEQVEGEWCHVVERPGADRLWFAAGRGCSLVRRERFAGDPSVRVALIELRSQREVAPGLWLPFDVHQVLFEPEQPSGRLVPFEETHCRVLRVDLSRADHIAFHFEPPPGTLVEDRDTGIMTQVPGGIGFVDEVVDLAELRLRCRARSHPNPATITGRGWNRLVLFASIGGMSSLILWSIGRGLYRSCNRPPESHSLEAGNAAAKADCRRE